MGDKTGIEWTDATWNPTVGCTIVSLGCTNCYAMKMAGRIERMNPGSHYAGTTKASKAGPVWTGKLTLAPEHILTLPLRWRRPRRIFVNSMSDLFHESVPDEWIDRVFAVMALAPQHTFQVLTKRSARMRTYLTRLDEEPVQDTVRRIVAAWPGRIPTPQQGIMFPLPNVWLGVSAEDQRRADERVPDLLATPAAVRFVSAEPLLGPIDFTNLGGGGSAKSYGAHGASAIWRGGHLRPCLDWIIVGGESGPGARPMHPQWARDIRDQCAAAGVPLHFKQFGHWREPEAGEFYDTSKGRMVSPPAFIVSLDGNVHCFEERAGPGAATMLGVGKSRAGRLLDGRTHDEMPHHSRFGREG